MSASGATVSRRAAWELGAPPVPPGGHVLVANAAGLFAPIADATYASGMAATGGSVAIRILGATTAIDAVGWGTAAGTWQEGTPAAAPAAGASLERLPGAAAGSWQDTGLNSRRLRRAPGPGPAEPGLCPDPARRASRSDAGPHRRAADAGPLGRRADTGSAGAPRRSRLPVTSPMAWRSPSRASRSPAPTSTTAVASSPMRPAGSRVLVTDGGFARGDHVRVTGELDDRFSQRTLRVAGDVRSPSSARAAIPAPPRSPPAPSARVAEGALVRVAGIDRRQRQPAHHRGRVRPRRWERRRAPRRPDRQRDRHLDLEGGHDRRPRRGRRPARLERLGLDRLPGHATRAR